MRNMFYSQFYRVYVAHYCETSEWDSTSRDNILDAEDAPLPRFGYRPRKTNLIRSHAPPSLLTPTLKFSGCRSLISFKASDDSLGVVVSMRCNKAPLQKIAKRNFSAHHPFASEQALYPQSTFSDCYDNQKRRLGITVGNAPCRR
ncbi:hypothetical protein MAP00_007081 [Monascus purpureus]|nr:hypothetical protein MAP00_007081 [Monascus purpureus]